MAKYKSGTYYWVKFPPHGVPEVAMYHIGYFLFCGTAHLLDEDQIDVIDEIDEIDEIAELRV